jgi:glycosyltransferase involved in cell wall biosynthesis
MNDKPLISVLIPVYNVESFVREAVISICNQTYDNLEIIVVDDYSTDKTFEIVEELLKYDARIKLFKNQKNLKIAETLNFALLQASGEYIARMDGDDFSEPTKIERQYSFLKSHPEYVLVGTNYILEDEIGNEISRTHYFSDFSNIIRIMRYESPVAHIWLTTKKMYDEVGRYRMSMVEDYDFLLRLISKGYKITNLHEYLYKVKLRQGNTFSKMGLTQRRAMKYVWTLHNERCSNNIDSYSDSSFSKAVLVSENDGIKFQKSTEYFNLYLKHRKSSFYKSLFFLLKSIYEYPNFQLDYIYRRSICRILKYIYLRRV